MTQSHYNFMRRCLGALLDKLDALSAEERAGDVVELELLAAVVDECVARGDTPEELAAYVRDVADDCAAEPEPMTDLEALAAWRPVVRH